MKDCLVTLLGEVEGSTLIFTRRKLHSEWLARQLELAGFDAGRIHSDRSQAQRVRALRGFREGKHRILVATDVAARGLDIPRIQHVINYSLPETIDDYIHRAGRTARGNAAGIVSSIGTWQDKITIQDIERRLNIKMPRCKVAGVDPYVEIKRPKQVRRRRLL
jgi:ATP-dependent RNA helicase RhlE